MKEWGEWKLVNEPFFMFVHRQNGYEISLTDMRDSASILDWVFQLHDKTWMTDKSMRDLLTAIREVLDPQANYCSGGVDKNADGGALARRYWDNPDPFGLAGTSH